MAAFLIALTKWHLHGEYTAAAQTYNAKAQQCIEEANRCRRLRDIHIADAQSLLK